MSEHNEAYGWVRFSERWPCETDCDIYGNIEIAHSGSRSFTTLGEAEAFRYNLNKSAWWRSPTPLPFITG